MYTDFTINDIIEQTYEIINELSIQNLNQFYLDAVKEKENLEV